MSVESWVSVGTETLYGLWLEGCCPNRAKVSVFQNFIFQG